MVDPSGVRFVTLDVVHAVIFYLSDEYCTTLYVVYVWGDRCGREVPHFDSRPVSISDPRVVMTPLGLCSIGLVVACYQDDFFMPIKGPRDANPRKTIREMRKNSTTERGRPVEIHRFLTRAKELFLGNLDNL